MKTVLAALALQSYHLRPRHFLKLPGQPNQVQLKETFPRVCASSSR